jgi:fructokinase
MPDLYAGIEAGGTKFNCIVANGPEDIRAEARFATTTPDETLGQVLDFLAPYRPSLAGVGIGCFGPVDLDPRSAAWGFITSTPKPGWQQVDVAGPVRRALDLPVAFDTDVNAAAIGEGRWGAAQGLDHFIYLTIGTGIGGGAVVAGRPLHGLVHPEMGHIRLPHDWTADPYAGHCPYHGDCFEGLASGPALKARWGAPAESLPADHPAWTLEAHYVALALASFICTLSPQRLILGGGVMTGSHLFPLIRREVQQLLNGYVRAPAVEEAIDDYIVPPALGGRAGVLGSLALAQRQHAS